MNIATRSSSTRRYSRRPADAGAAELRRWVGEKETTLIEVVMEGVVEFIPRAIGWACLKLLTLGRYRGFRQEDLLVEGGLGLAVIAGLCVIGYLWWPH